MFCRLFCLLCRTIHGITNSPKQPRAYADNLWSADGIISRQAVDTLMEVVISSGIFDGTYDVDELIDMRFVEQVMQESAQE